MVYEAEDDPRHEITRNENQSATLFPNMELFLMEESMSLLNFWPRGVDKTRFEGVIITLGDELTDARRKQAIELKEQLAVVFPEDISNMSASHNSARNGTLKSIPFSCLERRLYQFHEEIDRKIGDLTALRTELDRVIGSCRHGTVADCKIIETLGPRPN